MKIIPAIDLLNGECVRLYQGQYQQKTVYPKDPIALARQYEAWGAQSVHLVDLDGAKQKKPVQLDTIACIAAAVNMPIQFGGGVRTEEDIDRCLASGIHHIVLGSVAINQPTFCGQLIQKYAAVNFVLALDVTMDDSNPILVSEAWEQNSGQVLWDVVRYYQELGVCDILCTDISRDGTLAGPNLSLYEEAIARFPGIRWQASGGVCSDEDLQRLSRLKVHAVIIGRALYEGRLDLSKALGALPC